MKNKYELTYGNLILLLILEKFLKSICPFPKYTVNLEIGIGHKNYNKRPVIVRIYCDNDVDEGISGKFATLDDKQYEIYRDDYEILPEELEFLKQKLETFLIDNKQKIQNYLNK